MTRMESLLSFANRVLPLPGLSLQGEELVPGFENETITPRLPLVRVIATCMQYCTERRQSVPGCATMQVEQAPLERMCNGVYPHGVRMCNGVYPHGVRISVTSRFFDTGFVTHHLRRQNL